MNRNLENYLIAREAEFEQIGADRRAQLAPLAGFVRQKQAAGSAIRLLFVCTHNSRRSQIAQAAALAAAARYSIPLLQAFSGGTEATAFFPAAVKALRDAGFLLKSEDAGANPRYILQLDEHDAGQEFFSKQFAAPPNPQTDFAAVMVCSEADSACPFVPGAAARISLPFEDPKAFDGTEQAEASYAERCAQICREILWALKPTQSE